MLEIILYVGVNLDPFLFSSISNQFYLPGLPSQYLFNYSVLTTTYHSLHHHLLPGLISIKTP